MKKQEVIKARNAYKAETIAMLDTIYTKPVLGDGIDRGRAGKTFEGEVKSYLKNFKKAEISKQGADDGTITLSNGKRVPYEIKNGGGELATVSANGSVKWGFNLKGLFIYAPVYDVTRPVEFQTYVFDSAQAFVDGLAEKNLIRIKYSTAMNRKPRETRYHDRITIQSLGTTGRYNNMYDMCEECATLLADWER